MAELDDPCCTPEAQASCCEPEDRSDCCGHDDGCGCAAGRARPGIGMALRHSVKPDRSASVFAGADLEAVARVRELLAGYPPSSPSVALFVDGKPVFVLPRHEIEAKEAPEIAGILTAAFDRYCVKQPA